MGVGGGRRGRILFWWRWADKALLSGTQGSHEWLCKQPKREGTFPLAESAVKRFPVTVIAAFGGIISVQAVGGGGKGAGRQGKAKGDVWSACEELKDSASENQVPDAERLFWSRAGGWTNVWTAPFPPNGQTPPFSGVRVGGCTLILCSDSLGYLFQGFRASSNFLGSRDFRWESCQVI